MSTYEMAKHYYQDYTPPLWDRSRLDRLVEAGKLTGEEREKIVKGERDDGENG